MEIAYRLPIVRPVSLTLRTLSRLTYGATVPSSMTGTATSTSTATSDPANPPTDSEPSALTDSRRNGSATNGTRRQQQRGHQDDRAQPAQVGAAVGQLAAQPVAGRERHQHGGDGVGPDDRRGTEVRGEQACRGDLGAQAGRADHEGDRPHHERVRSAPGDLHQQRRRRLVRLPLSGASPRP